MCVEHPDFFSRRKFHLNTGASGRLCRNRMTAQSRLPRLLSPACSKLVTFGSKFFKCVQNGVSHIGKSQSLCYLRSLVFVFPVYIFLNAHQISPGFPDHFDGSLKWLPMSAPVNVITQNPQRCVGHSSLFLEKKNSFLFNFGCLPTSLKS